MDNKYPQTIQKAHDWLKSSTKACLIIPCGQADLRDYWIDILAEDFLNKYVPVVLDLRYTKVESLPESMREKLPPEMLDSVRDTHALHIINFGYTFVDEILEIKNLETNLIQNLERDVDEISKDFEFPIIWWIDPYTLDRIREEKPEILEKFELTDELKSEASEASELEGEDQITFGKVIARLSENAAGAQADPPHIPALMEIGRALTDLDMQPDSMHYFEQALELLDEEKTEEIAEVYLELAACSRVLGNVSDAMEYYEEIVSISTNQSLRAESYEGIGEIMYLGGENKKATQYFQAAAKAYLALGKKAEAGKMKAAIATALEVTGGGKMALAFWKEAAELIEEDEVLMRVWQKVANFSLEGGQTEDAKNAFSKALEIATKLGDENMIASFQDSLENHVEKAPKKKGWFGF